MAQGIAFNKEETMKVLEPYYKKGMSTTKACNYAGIDPSTVNRWLQADATLSLKVKAWQSELAMIARTNVERKIQGKEIVINIIRDPKTNEEMYREVKEVEGVPDVGLSQWYLRNKERDEFAERTENVTTNVSYEELKAMQEENLAKAEEIKADRKAKTKKGLYDTISENTRN
jgi:predicted transcriptional regulator